MKGLKNISDDTIMLQPFPQFDAAKEDAEAKADIEWMKQAIIAVRNIRAEMNIAPSKLLDAATRLLPAAQRRVEANRNFLHAWRDWKA